MTDEIIAGIEVKPCPDCGSRDAVMIWWEKSDMDYRCPDCDAHYGVR